LGLGRLPIPPHPLTNDIYYTILFLMCQHFFRKKVSKFDYVCELGEMFDDNLFGIPVIP